MPGVKLMKKVENMFNDVPVYMFLANAIFGLEDNGTDMPWLHHETITTPFILEKAVDNYGYYLAEKWCPIWDWGNRSNNPLRHLIEMKEIIEKYKEDTSEFKQNLHFFEEKIATQIQSMQHKLNLKY